MLALYEFRAQESQPAAVHHRATWCEPDGSAPLKPAVGYGAPASTPGDTRILTRTVPEAASSAADLADEEILVLIVDDHPGVRSAIEALIARTPGLRVVGSFSSGAAAVEGVARLRPAVVIMDLGMPGMNGVEATREICRGKVAPTVVAFSGSRELWREARAAGAAYTVLKDEDPQTLLTTIRTAASV
jgi:CheY-like chemotaxis protein